MFCLLLGLSMLSLLSGCASGPTYKDMHSGLAMPAPGNGRIFVYRSNSPLGMAIQPEVKLDENWVMGHAQPGGFFYADCPVGSHTLSCTTETECKATVPVAPGAASFVRLEPQIGLVVGHIQPVAVDPTQGEKEIQGYHYIGPAQQPAN
jgi:hypothetical protein